MSVRSLTERVSNLEQDVKSLQAQIEFMADEYDCFKEMCMTVFKDLGYEIKLDEKTTLDS
jgi:hypothetical protein